MNKLNTIRILTMIIALMGIGSLIYGVYGISTYEEKEIECYDNHNNEINNLTCISSPDYSFIIITLLNFVVTYVMFRTWEDFKE